MKKFQWLTLLVIFFSITSSASESKYLWSGGFCKEITASGFNQKIVLNIVEAIQTCKTLDDYGEVENAYKGLYLNINDIYHSVIKKSLKKRRANGVIGLRKIIIEDLEKTKKLDVDIETLEKLSIVGFVKKLMEELSIQFGVSFTEEYVEKGSLQSKIYFIDEFLFQEKHSGPEGQLEYIISQTYDENVEERLKEKNNLLLLEELNRDL